MSFGKFHESEGLAAIARAMRLKKEQQDAGGDCQAIPPDDKKLSSHEPSEDRPRDAVKEEVEEGKKKKKKSKKRKEEEIGSGSDVEEEDKDQEHRKSKKKSKSSKMAAEDSHDKKSEKGEAGEKKSAEKKKKKKKGKADSSEDGEEHGEKRKKADEEAGPVLRLVRKLQEVEESHGALKDVAALSKGKDVPAEVQDRLLAASSSAGARAVSLLLRGLQRASELRAQSMLRRKPGQQLGPASQKRKKGPAAHGLAFGTAEEALHTDLASAGSPGLHAQKLWSAVLQCNGEAVAAARAAMRGSAASVSQREAAAAAGGEGENGRAGEPNQLWGTFADFYRASFVDAYAEDLEAMRQAASADRPVKPEVLLKCMQAGMGLFAEDMQRLMMADHKTGTTSSAHHHALEDSAAVDATPSAGNMLVYDLLYGRL